MSIKESVERTVSQAAINKAVDELKKDPEHNLAGFVDRVAGIADKLPLQPIFKEQLRGVKELVDSDRPGKQLLVHLLKDTDGQVLKTLVGAFVIDASWFGVRTQRSVTEEEGFNVPWFMLIDPTERCNYKCTGCWAGSYQQAKEMSFETFDRVLTEAGALGIHFVVVSGGEPTCY
ncbi:MAG TPA: radical SAM protein, partial [Candidatus Cryosericum sp.]|nr:radical SAM protein [Candidatus Cryosericum sp.]